MTEPAIVIKKWIFVADHQGNVHAAQGGEAFRTVEVREELSKAVEVDQVVAVTAERITEAVYLQGQIIAP